MFAKCTKQERCSFLFVVFANVSYNSCNKGSGQFVCCHISKPVCTSNVTSRVSLSKRPLCTHNGRFMNYANTMKACCFQKVRDPWTYSRMCITAHRPTALAPKRPYSYKSFTRANNHCHCKINACCITFYYKQSIINADPKSTHNYMPTSTKQSIKTILILKAPVFVLMCVASA
jgi:hypothetical protein